MGFFSGSSTSTVKPISELVDAGVFSGAKQNEATKKLAEQFQGNLQGSEFIQNPQVMNDLIKKLAGGGSFLSDNLRSSVLDASQGEFNKRGIGRLTPNEAGASLAPFELQAQQGAIQKLAGLAQARGLDMNSFMQLISESRPDLLVGSQTTGKNKPSTLAKISGLLSVADQFGYVTSGGSGLANTSSAARNVAGAAGGAAALSDRRLKSNISRIGMFDNGIGIYKFTYKWSPVMYMGVMSDEVRKVIPEAVIVTDSGYDAVYYSLL